MLFLSRLVQVPIAYRLVPGLHNNPCLFRWDVFRRLTAFGVGIVLASLCVVANNSGVRWLMGSLISPEFVAPLTIMLMPSLLLTQIIRAMTATIMPAASAYEASDNQDGLWDLLVRGQRYKFILVLAAILSASLLLEKICLSCGLDTSTPF